MSKEAKNTLKTILTYAVLILMALVMLVPFAWMISASLKLEKDVFSYPIVWIPKDPVWSNYQEIWKKVPLLQGFFNTTKLTVCTTILQLLTSSFAAYAFAKLEFKGRDLIFMLYVMTIAIPWQVYMVPQYKMMTMFHLVDSHLGLILMHAFTATGVFLIRQFMDTVPDELLEAAKVDGCPEYRIFIQIVIPLIKPVLISLVVFTFVTSWNDFLWPLVSTSNSDMYTLTVALSLLKTQYQTNYGLIMAGATVSFLFPFIMYVFLQKQFVEGIALSGIKG